jgi:hypothetical protein
VIEDGLLNSAPSRLDSTFVKQLIGSGLRFQLGFVGILLLILCAQRAPFIRIQNPDRPANNVLRNFSRPRSVRIVHHQPRVGKPTIQVEEVIETSVISAAKDVLRYCATAAAHTLANSADRKSS